MDFLDFYDWQPVAAESAGDHPWAIVFFFTTLLGAFVLANWTREKPRKRR